MRNPRIILDFDDAIFLGPRGQPDRWCRRAFETAVKISSRVIAGNTYLAENAAAPEKTTVIPTVIETDRYQPRENRPPGREVVVGWMGTTGHFGELSVLVPMIEKLLRTHPHVTFRFVSNANCPRLPDHPRVEQVRWSAESELALLRSFDVGLMPLSDSPWNRGKCGFKLIQYMAVGVPPIASAVGANVEIVGQGRDAAGLLVRPEESWASAVELLVEDPELRARLGACARARAVECYSVRSVLPTYLRLFSEVASGGNSRYPA
jgi:glycosyltransferase involved in cell wall biosynthesis